MISTRLPRFRAVFGLLTVCSTMVVGANPQRPGDSKMANLWPNWKLITSNWTTGSQNHVLRKLRDDLDARYGYGSNGRLNPEVVATYRQNALRAPRDVQALFLWAYGEYRLPATPDMKVPNDLRAALAALAPPWPRELARAWYLLGSIREQLDIGYVPVGIRLADTDAADLDVRVQLAHWAFGKQCPVRLGVKYGREAVALRPDVPGTHGALSRALFIEWVYLDGAPKLAALREAIAENQRYIDLLPTFAPPGRREKMQAMGDAWKSMLAKETLAQEARKRAKSPAVRSAVSH